MHVPYTCGLLTAANEQRHGFIKLRGVYADREVRMMVNAGLVNATFATDDYGAFASINRVLAAGQTFLRASNEQSALSPATTRARAPMTASQNAVVGKWSARLG